MEILKNLIVISSCAIVISACATTGDPNAGGLWGWNEEKAQERQVKLESRASDLKSQNERLSEDNKGLRNTQTNLKNKEEELTRQLAGLIDERKQMVKQLHEAAKNYDIKEAKLIELREKYAASKTEYENIKTKYGRLGSIESKQHFLNEVASENNKLIDEILLLIGS